LVAPGDVSKPESVEAIAKSISSWHGRLDILVNNAGTNVRARRWHELSPDSIDAVLRTNLSAAFYCSAAAIKLMRPKSDGLLKHISSWVGRFLNNIGGGGYTAAKSVLIAMSHTINLEEHDNGLRSTVIMPAEVATPILDSRPAPPSAEDRALMLQPAELAELILFVAQRPKSVCLNEIVISPTSNRLLSVT
jgi:NAD(P)-dependent dehydrogenase (short-subunit alcohol dehydrogenase family)